MCMCAWVPNVCSLVQCPHVMRGITKVRDAIIFMGAMTLSLFVFFELQSLKTTTILLKDRSTAIHSELHTIASKQRTKDDAILLELRTLVRAWKDAKDGMGPHVQGDAAPHFQVCLTCLCMHACA